jgi:hypothetical protein
MIQCRPDPRSRRIIDSEVTMNRRKLTTFSAFALSALVAISGVVLAAETIGFRDDVYPIIEVRCLDCHSPGGEGYEQSGLDLRTYEGLMAGTRFGPVVVPGSAFTSNLVVLVEGRAAPEIGMPFHRKKLTKCEIGILRSWVNQGARDN